MNETDYINKRKMENRKNFTSTADLHQQILLMFENAGRDVDPIAVESQSQANSEASKLVNDLLTPHDWDFQVNVMNRAMGLINGGLLQYDQCIKQLSQINQPLISAAKNLRSTLVKQSCLLISQLAFELGVRFDIFGEMIIPLSSQTSHGTQIIAESCRCTIMNIARCCPTKKVLRSVLDLSKMKSASNREISSECLCFICDKWNTSIIEQNNEFIIESLLRLMGDASQNTRKISRDASQVFIEKYPQYKEKLVSEIDERSAQVISKRRSKSPHTSFLPVPKKRRSNNNNNIKRPRHQEQEPSALKRAPVAEIDLSSRSKSTLPSRPSTFAIKANLKLEKGKEEEFLDVVEEYVNTNQQFELSQSLNSIIAGLFACAFSDDENIHLRAIDMIGNLVFTFPKNFLPHLSKLIEILITFNEKNINKYDQMLRDLQSIYDPNVLLLNTENLQISTRLLKFVALLCDDAETDLKKDQICINVYDIAMTLLKNEPEHSKKVIFAICRQNREFIERQKNKDQILDLISQYQENPEYPFFNPRGVSIWCDEVRKFIKTSRFSSQKEGLFNEISKGLSLTNEKDLIIVLIIDILKLTNNEQFEKFLPDIILYYKNRNAKNIQKLIKYLIATVDNKLFINNLLPLIDELYDEDIRNLIDILIEVIKSGNKDKVTEAFDYITSTLGDLIDHRDSEVRRVVIMAYVVLSDVFPEKTAMVISNLPKVPQKLIAFYQNQQK
ncbi:hypothetical protein TRFO_19257 [Tritrichomonas foetus]|uniref:CLASP N-terminal domain-containing protein n=1 Tax=Tritrichomonas foetus TaxID=1144522 RepID=A0A1J4KPL6_9EUKA|nr:hypothetical protein TRFO_19257 [Tritrichomonas foetus]|eukprot:OHT11365.1 hypothetical protein TRFO_19257 [Tritrichomonas foetus]